MINVIASIQVKPEFLAPYLKILRENVPAVRAEAGCIEYQPTVDVASGLPPQRFEPDTVTLIEKWSTLEALKTHLVAPHMATYREKVKTMVVGVTLKVLQEA
jgi:quinol monooxygenase YgiN